MSEEKKFHPKVSVIVPAKNAAATIRDLLESLMRVDYERENFEVIVVDGNSTDNTREIVAEYPVRLAIEEKPCLNAARNTGVRLSSGEILVFTDADCVVPRDWIRKTVENFKDPQVGCVGGNVRGCHQDFLSQYADNSLLPVLRNFKKRKILTTVKPPLQYPAGCNMALRRSVVEEVGEFDEGILHGFDEDELVERVCKRGYKMVLDPEVLVRHKHRSSLRCLLKQTFQYGRGGGLLLRTKGIGNSFSLWILLSILGFAIWLSLIILSAFLTLTTGSASPLAFPLALILTPLVSLMAFYAYQTLKERRGMYKGIIAYPFIDVLRAIAFLSGGIYQILKPGTVECKQAKPRGDLK